MRVRLGRLRPDAFALLRCEEAAQSRLESLSHHSARWYLSLEKDPVPTDHAHQTSAYRKKQKMKAAVSAQFLESDA
jgi:hypothetical protein